MKRIKEIIIISSIAIAFASLSTPCNAYSLRITDSNDNTSIFKVDDNLSWEVTEETLSLTNHVTGNEYYIKDLKEFNYISDVATTIDLISSVNANPEIHLTCDKISLISDSETPQTYSIFNTAGTLVEQRSFINATEIPLSSFPAGAYILTLNDLTSVKFIVK